MDVEKGTRQLKNLIEKLERNSRTLRSHPTIEKIERGELSQAQLRHWATQLFIGNKAHNANILGLIYAKCDDFPGRKAIVENLIEEELGRVSGKDAETIVGRWKDGRVGTVIAARPYSEYGAVVFEGRKAVENHPRPGGSDYRPLVEQVVKFFQTGKSPVDTAETLEIFSDTVKIPVEQLRGMVRPVYATNLSAAQIQPVLTVAERFKLIDASVDSRMCVVGSVMFLLGALIVAIAARSLALAPTPARAGRAR